MSDKFVAYLRKEYERLERELAAASRQKPIDQFHLARLKKLKLAIRDQIAVHERPAQSERAA
jgi:hypothetical protein